MQGFSSSCPKGIMAAEESPTAMSRAGNPSSKRSHDFNEQGCNGGDTNEYDLKGGKETLVRVNLSEPGIGL